MQEQDKRAQAVIIATCVICIGDKEMPILLDSGASVTTATTWFAHRANQVVAERNRISQQAKQSQMHRRATLLALFWICKSAGGANIFKFEQWLCK